MGKQPPILLSLKRAHEQAKEWLGQVCRIEQLQVAGAFHFWNDRSKSVP